MDDLDRAKYARYDAEAALDYLIRARDLLKRANAPKTLARVRLALSSAKGAVRNAECREARARSAKGA